MHPFERTPAFFFRTFDKFPFSFTKARKNRPSCIRRIPYITNKYVSVRFNASGVAEVRRKFRLASVRWSEHRDRTEGWIDVQGFPQNRATPPFTVGRR